MGAAKGVLRGFKGLVANSTVGVANSVSRFSGTLYMSLRGAGGRMMSETDLDNPTNII